MATKNKERKVLEDPDVVAEKLESAEIFLVQNQKWVLIAVGVVLLAIAGIFTFNYYKKTRTEQAQNDMFRSVFLFESDSLNKALKGDGNTMGLAEIADEYKMTKPGNLAHFYSGVAYLKNGKFQDAIDQLKDFSSSDILVQARAYSLLGDAYMELKNYDDAANYYNKAADYKPNKFFTPQYLIKAALAHEKKGDNEAAMEAYDKIIEEYFDSSEFTEARKNKARLESVLKK